MPVLVVIAAIIAIALYVWLCYAAITYIVLPVLPYAVLFGVVAGALFTVVVVVATLLGAGTFAPGIVSNADVATALPKRKKSAFPRDDAWPQYLFAQDQADLEAAARQVFGRLSAFWTAVVRFCRQAAPMFFFWPLLLIPAVALVVMTIAVTGSAVMVGAVLLVALAVLLGGWLAVAGTLRGLDFGVRKLRHAKATCPHPGCNERTMLPTFRCRTCGRLHRDLRPGRQGALAHRCGCGEPLPTTVIRAARGLVAVCPRCELPLHTGSAVLTDVVVPVFGPPSAGKTRFVYAGIVALARHVSALNGTMRAVGANNEALLADASKIITSGQDTAKTRVGAPAAITVRVASGRRKGLLHVFDAAGEAFLDRTSAAGLAYLADTHGLVFVLDPFSIKAVRDQLRADRHTLDRAHAAAADPEQSYQITVQWLRERQVQVNRQPLAVVLVKADVLARVPSAARLVRGCSNEDIERWLQDHHLDNLVEAVRRDFAEVRYFLVSSWDDGAGPGGRAGLVSPARPLLWLLEKAGLAINLEKEKVPS